MEARVAGEWRVDEATKNQTAVMGESS